MLMPKLGLLGGWYRQGLIAYQQRNLPSNSNKNDIKYRAHDAVLKFEYKLYRQGHELIVIELLFTDMKIEDEL